MATKKNKYLESIAKSQAKIDAYKEKQQESNNIIAVARDYISYDRLRSINNVGESPYKNLDIIQANRQKAKDAETPSPWKTYNNAPDAGSTFNRTQRDVMNSVPASVINETEYMKSLPNDAYRNAYRYMKSNDNGGLYVSPYFSKGIEGKEKLQYNNPEWNRLSEGEKKGYLEWAQQELEKESKKKRPNLERDNKYLNYAMSILNETNQTVRTIGDTHNISGNLFRAFVPDRIEDALGMNKESADTFNKDQELQIMLNMMPEEVRQYLNTGMVNLVREGQTLDTAEAIEDYLAKYYPPDVLEKLTKYARKVENIQKQQARNEDTERKMENPFYATVVAPARQIGADLLVKPVAGAVDFVRASSEANKGVYGEFDPLQTEAQRMAQDARYINESINSGLGPAGRFTYGTAVSAAESAARMYLAGGLAKTMPFLNTETASKVLLTGMMSTAVFNDDLNENIQKGMPLEDAIGSAVAHSVFESLFEEVSLDKLGYFQDAPVLRSKKEFVKALGKAAFVEGSEEAFTDIANELYDHYVGNYDFSEYKAFKDKYLASNPDASDAEVWWNFTKQFSWQVAQSFAGGALSSFALSSTKNMSALHRGEIYVQNGKNVSDADYNRMNAFVEEMAAVNPNIANQLAEATEGGEDARRGFVKMVADEYSNKFNKEIARADSKDKLNVVMNNVNSVMNGAISEDTFNAYNAKLVELGETPADYNTFVQNRQRGGETTFSDLAYGRGDNAIQRNIVEASKSIAETRENAKLSESERETAINELRGKVEQNVKKAEDMVARYAQMGKALDSPEVRQFESVLGLENMAQIYSAGKIASENKMLPSVTGRGGKLYAVDKNSEGARAIFGENIDHIQDVPFNELQKTTAYSLGKVLAKMTGVDVAFYKSDRQKVQNGAFHRNSNTIYIDVNAGVSGADAAVGEVFSHELTHWIRSKNEEGYQRLLDFVKADLGDSYDSMLKDHMDRLGLDEDVAGEEIVAEACQRMLKDSETFKRYASADMEGAKTLLQRLVDFVRKLRDAFKGSLNNEATRMIQNLEGLQQTWETALQEAIGEQTAMEGGIDVETFDDTAVRDSIRTVLDEKQRERVSKMLQEKLGVDKKTADDYIENEQTIASLIFDNIGFLDYKPDDRYEAIKKNSDYPQGTVDMTNLCRKRAIFTQIFDSLQEHFPNRLFNAMDIADIREVLKTNGYQVACALCFVEDRRQRVGEIAENFIERLKESNGKTITVVNSKGETKELFMTKDLANTDVARRAGFKYKDAIKVTDKYIPNQYDLVTYEGFKALSENHPQVAVAFTRANNYLGMSSARLVEGRAEYKRDILKYTPTQVKRINNKGGLRIFSFSDFEAVHLLDICQVIMDASAVGLKIQAYTKVPAFAKLVANTGIKLNRSLIASGKGFKVNADGSRTLTYDTHEGIDIEDRDFFDSSDNPNIGNILVGISDEHIRLAMLDDFVDYIIPFHSNQGKNVLAVKGISHWTNYKEYQRERYADGRKGARDVNIYTQVIDKYHPANKVEFVEAFLKECKAQGKIPRFDQFLNKVNGEYVYTPGYEKLLLDFKLFDKQGNILPQNTVNPNIDMEVATRILDDEVKGAEKREQVSGKIIKELEKKYEVRNSSRDSERGTSADELMKNNPELTKEQAEFLEGTKTIDENGRLIKYAFPMGLIYEESKKLGDYIRTVNPWVWSEHGKQTWIYKELLSEIQSSGYDSIIFDNPKGSPVNVYDGPARWGRGYNGDVYIFDRANVLSSENKTPKKLFSISKGNSEETDASGRVLTNAQSEYFKDSKVRDADGKLKVMYHGTNQYGFTVFDAKNSDDKLSLFFTDSPDIADSYIRSNGGIYDVYLNITNPLEIDANDDYWSKIVTSKGEEKNVERVTIEPSEKNKMPFIFLSKEEANKFEEKYHISEWQKLIAEARKNGTVEWNGQEYDEYEIEDEINSIEDDAYHDYYQMIRGNRVPINARDFFSNPDNYTWFDFYAMINELSNDTDDGFEETVGHWKEDGVPLRDAVDEWLSNWRESEIEYGGITSEEFDEKLDFTFTGLPSNTFNEGKEVKTTRQIARIAYNEGHDGVIIRNVRDVGPAGLKRKDANETSMVVVAFSSNQVKSVDNLNPTEDKDIRFSSRDSEGHNLSAGQQEYFADSKVRDENGNLQVVYHGTDAGEFYVFEPSEWVDEVSGKTRVKGYFSESKDYATAYGETVPYYLNIKNPLNAMDRWAMTLNEWEKWFASKGIKGVKFDTSIEKDTVKGGKFEAGTEYSFYEIIDNMGYYWNGDGNVTEKIEEAGYDGICWDENGTCWVPFNRNAIKRTDNLNPTESDDIRFSYRDLANSESEILVNALKNDATLVDQFGARKSVEAYAKAYGELKEMENQAIEYAKQLKKGTSPSEREAILRKQVRLDRAILNKTTELTEMRNQRVIRDLLIDEWEKRDEMIAIGRAEERYQTRKVLEDKYGEELKALRAKSKAKQTEIRNRFEINKRKKNIETKAKALMKMILNPTEKKHIPSVLVNPITDLLDSIDYWTPAEGRPTTKKSESLRTRFEDFRSAINEYQKQIDDGAEQIELMFDPEFLETVDDLCNSVKGIDNVNDMSVQDIIDLDHTLTELLHLISRGNKMIKAYHYETIKDAVDATAETMDKLDTLSSKTSAKGNLRMRLNAGMADSYAFGRYAGDGTKQIIDSLSKAFEEKISKVKQAIEFTQEALKPYKKDLKKWSKDTHEFTLSTTDEKGNPNKISLTVGQMMELYLLNKREQARGHIYGGGIRVEDRKGRYTESVKVTEEDVQEIVNYLATVPGAIEVADKLQKYGATTITGWGNEASNLMYGFAKFTEPDYWQIRSDSSALKDNENTEAALNASMYRLQNMGRTKAVKKGANNAIYVGDVFDTWSKTIDEMTSYASILPSTTDAMRWWNSRIVNESGDAVRIKKLLESKLGTDMTRVFTETIKALNGGIMGTDSLESLVKVLTGKAKAAAVAGNLRVVLQQPTAYTRAAAVIEPKYLLKALKMKPNAKEAQEHSAIAWHKAQGFYSNGLAPSLRKLVIGDGSFGENLTEKSLWLAGKADDITWGALWNASKLKVEDENKALKKGSDEYWEEVNKVFSDIINNTQVVDTPLTKSTWMRGNGLGVFFTAFMAEPTKTYSMVMTAVEDLVRNPKSKQAQKTVALVGTVFAVNAAVNALAQALADAARDDDKEKSYWEKYAEKYTEDIKDNLNPLTYIPVVKDIFSLWNGYSNNNLAMQAAQNTVYAVQELQKIAKGTSKKTLFGQMETCAKAVSSWTGIPFGNVMRTFNSFGNIVGIDTFRRKKYTKSELGRNVVLSIKEGNTAEATEYWNQLVREVGEDEISEAYGYISTYLAEHDDNVDAYAVAFLEDANNLETQAEDLMRKYEYNEYITLDVATDAIRKAARADQKAEAEAKGEKYKQTVSSTNSGGTIYNSSDVNRALERGNIDEAQKVIDKINAGYKTQGSNSTAKSAVSNYWKPKYLSATGAERDRIARMLYKLKNNGKQMFSSKDLQKWVSDANKSKK